MVSAGSMQAGTQRNFPPGKLPAFFGRAVDELAVAQDGKLPQKLSDGLSKERICISAN
jgi:hypothetical protein